MAISATYLTLQRQVADELGNRIDLLSPLSDSNLTLSPIQNAIQSAIAKWEREPFYFNEYYDTAFFTTVSSTEFYGVAAAPAIATVVNIERLHILIASRRYSLVPRRWVYLQDVSISPSTTGKPTDYAYFASQIRLYPIPDGAYPVTITGTKQFTALSADGDANVWTQDGYDLIRAEAKLILAQEVLHDSEMATRMEWAIYGNPTTQTLGILDLLRAETARRSNLGLIRAVRTSNGAQPTGKAAQRVS